MYLHNTNLLMQAVYFKKVLFIASIKENISIKYYRRIKNECTVLIKIGNKNSTQFEIKYIKLKRKSCFSTFFSDNEFNFQKN